LRRDDLRSRLDELDAVVGLACDRPGLLFQLWQTAQPYQCAAARNAGRHSADAVRSTADLDLKIQLRSIRTRATGLLILPQEALRHVS